MKKFYVTVTFVLFVTGAYSQIQFQPYVSIPTVADSEAVGTGDFNSDGKRDVAVLTSGYAGTAADQFKLCIYLQNASGNLDAPVKYSYLLAQSAAIALAVHDLNMDGRDDIAIGYGTKIGIFYQTASGSMSAQTVVETGYLVKSLAIGNLNGDVLPDIAVGCQDSGNSYVRILPQSVGGTFSTAYNQALSGVYMREIAIGDVNSDGRADIVVAVFEGVRVFLQNSFNSFSGFQAFDTGLSGHSVNAVSVGDLDFDGDLDIAFAYGGNSPSAMIGRLINNNGALSVIAPLPAYDIPECLEIRDVNGDNKNEIIAVHGGWLNVSVYRQVSAGNFGAYSLFPIPYASHYEAMALAVADVNSNNKPDILIADYAALVILYNSSPLGVPERENLHSFLGPNPAGATIFLRPLSPSSTASLQVIDGNGRVCLSREWQSFDTENLIDVSALTRGLYLFKLTIDEITETHKILIK